MWNRAITSRLAAVSAALLFGQLAACSSGRGASTSPDAEDAGPESEGGSTVDATDEAKPERDAGGGHDASAGHDAAGGPAVGQDAGCDPTCTGKSCGPDGCGGSCGTCASGTTCSPEGNCECEPDCTGKSCGANGCGGTCGTCAAGSTCNASDVCAANPHYVNCEPAGKPEAACTCTPDSNTGTTIYDGITDCTATSSVGGLPESEFCCADSTYPDPGSSCACYVDTNEWFCGNDQTYCTCDYVSAGEASAWSNIRTTTCNNAPGANGVPWICWSSGCECDCFEDTSTAKPPWPNATVVSNCATPPAGCEPSPTSCPAGTESVSQCSRGPTATSPGGGCGTACPPFCADGVCCTGVCTGGSCGLDCE